MTVLVTDGKSLQSKDFQNGSNNNIKIFYAVFNLPVEVAGVTIAHF